MKKAILCFAVCGIAHAQSSDVGLSADVGTLGAGVHLILPVQQGFNARLGVSGANYNYNGSTSDVNYDFKLKLQTIDALLDWYPMSGNFHLTGGLFHNGNKVTATAKPNVNGSYTINGNTYTVSQAGSIDGDIEFRSAAPYLGLGWGGQIGNAKGWGFTSDFGVMFQGAPASTLTSSGCVASAQTCAQLYSDLNAETTSLDQKTNNFKYYPVVRIGVTYAF